MTAPSQCPGLDGAVVSRHHDLLGNGTAFGAAVGGGAEIVTAGAAEAGQLTATGGSKEECRRQQDCRDGGEWESDAEPLSKRTVVHVGDAREAPIIRLIHPDVRVPDVFGNKSPRVEGSAAAVECGKEELATQGLDAKCGVRHSTWENETVGAMVASY